MSSANVSAPRATNTAVPQLSKRALGALRMGAAAELWVACKPFTIEVAGVKKEEKELLLGSVHLALVMHFSPKWKRELTGKNTKRLSVPYTREPTKIVVDWMVAGGGQKLGTPELPYPKQDLSKLKILKSLATTLEIESLVGLIDKDIAAAALGPSPLPASGLAPKPTVKDAVPSEKLCWFCHKRGHVRKDCPERNAVHVTWSHGETISMKGTGSTAEGRSPKKSPTTPVGEPSSTTKVKLIPFSGQIRARDADGWLYSLDYRHIELEIDWPGKPGFCVFRGSGRVDSW